MDYEQLEKRIRTAADHAAPDGLEQLLAGLPEQKGRVIPMTEPKKKNRWLPLAGLAAVLALLIAGGAFGWNAWQTNAVACVVSLDVNPSIELKVNRQERVLSCTPLNGDAAQVLFEMDGGADLEGAKLDVAVNAIVGALVRHGYLDSISSALLISVEDRDQARADRLQAELTGAVAALLQQESAAAAVYSQWVAQDAALDEMAQTNNISAGKATLVNQALALNSALQFEKLAALSVEELRQLIAAGAPAMPIGVAQARYLAEEYAGTLATDSVVVTAEPELDDPVPHYEVEIHTYYEELEYKVDAYTGAILSGIPDILSLHSPTEPPSTVPDAITPEQAQNAALEHMGAQYPELARNNVFSPDVVVWTETDNGREQYHVEFYCGEYWFVYEIHTQSGEVLDWGTTYQGPPAPSDPPPQTSAPTPAQNTPAPAASPTPAQNTPAPAASPTPAQNTPAPEPSPAPSQAVSVYIGEEAAKAAAYAHAGCQAGDVAYVTCKLDWDDRCYEVEFICGDYEYDYEIDCYSAEVRKHECELHYTAGSHHGDAHHSDGHSSGGTAAYIGESAALAAAYNHAGVSASNAFGVKAELEWEDGRMIYEVEFQVGRTEYEYEIDASTGAVLKYETEIDD